MNPCDSFYFARKPFFRQRENVLAPRYTPIKHLGPFSGYPFGVNSPQTAGIAGGLQWHEVTKDERIVGAALEEMLPVLRSEKLLESGEDCEWCRYAKLRVDPMGGGKNPAQTRRTSRKPDALVKSPEDDKNINGLKPCYNWIFAVFFIS